MCDPGKVSGKQRQAEVAKASASFNATALTYPAMADCDHVIRTLGSDPSLAS